MDEPVSPPSSIVRPAGRDAAGAPCAGHRWFRPAVLGHMVAALLGLAAVIFTLWFVQTNPALPGIFRGLLQPWGWGGGEFDGAGLAWGVGAVAVFTVIGWFYLEGLEVYLPVSAALALAYLFGLGLAGFVFESLAIPFLLYRGTLALGLGALLVALALRVWWRGRRAPEDGFSGDIGVRENMMRRVLARGAYAASIARPRGLLSRAWQGLAVGLIALITLAIFWHALLYPEVYWDAMILYLGYARQTFLAHGFPIKVTGQVGIGLGANYPHLFSVLGSGVAAAAGAWSELPQRLICPLAGLATTLLVYHTSLRLTRHVNAALAFALLYRAIPLGIVYDQYASDYALALLCGAAFLYLALLYIETGLSGYLAAATLLIGLSMHINYLMGILWGPWLVMLLAAHLGAPVTAAWKLAAPESAWAGEAPWAMLERRPRLGRLLGSTRFWLILLASVAIGSTWHIRNWVVTGNPVYAFFYNILGGRHINDEVMKAAAVEWQANGAGIGQLTEQMLGAAAKGGPLGGTIAQRAHAAFAYFAGPLGDGRMWNQAYRTEPLLLGFSVGGFLAWLGLTLAAPLARGRRIVTWPAASRFGLVVATLTVALLAFHFILAPFYLYQIIVILPCLALLAALAWPWWRRRPWRWLLGGLTLWIGLVPGLAMALMGFKVVGSFELPGGRVESPLTLYPLRHPLPPPYRFYQWRFGEDARMWEFINKNLKGEMLLTHENRDLALDPSITIVNLDDWTDQWNMQALWRVPDPAERVRQLVERYNIHYYLRIPNEDAAPSNARMGAAAWPGLGLAQLIHEAGENRLYRLTPPPRH